MNSFTMCCDVGEKRGDMGRYGDENEEEEEVNYTIYFF